MDTRLLTGLIVVSLGLHGLALVKIADLEEDLQATASRAIDQGRWQHTENALGRLADRLAELEQESGLVSESTVTWEADEASCAGVPARFEAALNRLPANATVTLAYWPTWDLLATTPGPAGSLGGTVTNGTVETVTAVVDVNALTVVAEAELLDVHNYAYRWILDADALKASSRTFHLDLVGKLGGPARGGAFELDGDRELITVTGSPNTRACDRVDAAFLVLRFDGEREALSRALTPASGPDTWTTAIPREDYDAARELHIEWHLTDGRVLTHVIPKAPAADR